MKKFYPAYFTFPALIIFFIFFAIPVLISFVMSFTNWNINKLFQPKFNGISNFTFLIQDERFVLAISNTLKFAVITTVSIVIVGLLLALALNRALYAKAFFRTAFYLPAVLSLIVVGIMFTSILEVDGVFNQVLAALGLSSLQNDWLGNPGTALNCTIFVQIWKWSGFAMAIFLAGLQGIPRDYYEATTIDGANPWQQFRAITFPLLAPAFTVVVTMNTIGGFKVFEQVYVMTGGGPGYASQVLGTYIYQTFSKGMLGRSTAMGLLLFVFTTIIAVALNKFLRSREVEL